MLWFATGLRAAKRAIVTFLSLEPAVLSQSGAMDTQDTMDTLKGILTELGIPKELLRQDALLRQDLQLDSTETVEISLRLKQQLGISIKLWGRQDITLSQVCHLVEAARLTSSQNVP